MNLLRKLWIFIYLTLMISVGAFLISLAIETVTPEMVNGVLRSVSGSQALQIALYALGGIFTLIGIIGPLKMASGLSTDSMIAIKNPDGEVTVSIKAVEDYIRKISKDIPGINEVRSRVEVRRGGFNVICHVSLSASSNIPDITDRIQLAVRSRLHNMLGMEEKIKIKMHVSRISTGPREGSSAEEELGPAEIPFR